MTGYCLLAFMAGGNLPTEGEFARSVAQAEQFLLRDLQPDGIYRSASDSKYMYEHGIATVALAELQGQSPVPKRREKLELAIKLISESQATRGEHRGGWRYRPEPSDADLSVTVLQVVALRAAKNVGIDVSQATIDAAVDYVRRCRVGASGGFAYQAGGGGAGFARTAAAVYSLQVCGFYEDPLVRLGTDYLFANVNERQHWTYGANYATPAIYMVGPDRFRQWYGLMQARLVPSAIRAGDEAWWEGAGNDGGPVYATACHTTILAIPWNLLPLYQR
jgi:hypothetical protein